MASAGLVPTTQKVSRDAKNRTPVIEEVLTNVDFFMTSPFYLERILVGTNNL